MIFFDGALSMMTTDEEEQQTAEAVPAADANAIKGKTLCFGK